MNFNYKYKEGEIITNISIIILLNRFYGMIDSL